MLCSIDISEASELDFTLQVFGTTANAVEPRFIIIGGEFAIVCFCKPEENSVKVSIPRLEGILPAGNYGVKFEVLLGGQIFVPIEDEIELKEAVKIEASISPTVKQTVTATPKIEVKLTQRPVQQEAVVEEEIAQAPVARPLRKPEPTLEAAPPAVRVDPLEDVRNLDTGKNFPLFKTLSKK